MGNVINRKTNGPYYDNNELVFHYLNCFQIMGDGDMYMNNLLRDYVSRRK